jgi:hypothetical protein
VTNSSSSSFILAFRDEDSIYSTLKEQFPEDITEGWSAGETGYFHQLLNEIEHSKRLTREGLIETFDCEKYSIIWDIKSKLRREMNMDYWAAHDYFETEEGKKIIEEAYEEELASFLANVGNNKVVVEVDHGDGGNGEDGVLEHNILPFLDCTIRSFSHH